MNPVLVRGLGLVSAVGETEVAILVPVARRGAFGRHRGETILQIEQISLELMLVVSLGLILESNDLFLCQLWCCVLTSWHLIDHD